jgi:Nuclear condensing complex subunits, C-term domain
VLFINIYEAEYTEYTDLNFVTNDQARCKPASGPTMSTMDLSAHLQAVLLPWFQRQQQDDQPAVVVTNVMKQLQEEILSWQMQHAVSIRDATSTTTESSDEALAKALIYYMDCATAAVPSKVPLEVSDDLSPVERAYDLVIGLALSSTAVWHLVRDRVTTTYAVALLERVRVAACIFGGRAAAAAGGCSPEEESVLRTLLLQRTTDKSAAVRHAALRACRFLFYNDQSYFPLDVQDALLERLQHDTSAANRMAALSSLPLNLQTQPHWLDRVRDVSPKVRLAALARLSALARDSTFSSAEIRYLAQAGGLTGEAAWAVPEAAAPLCAATRRFLISLLPTVEACNPVLFLQRYVNIVHYDDNDDKVGPAICQVLWDYYHGEQDPWLSPADQRQFVAAMKQSLVAPVLVETTLATDTSTAATRMRLYQIYWWRQVVQRSGVMDDAVELPLLCDALQHYVTELVRILASGTAEEPMEAPTEDDEVVVDDEMAAMTLQDILITAAQELLKLMAHQCSASTLEEGARRHLVQQLTSLLSSLLIPDDLVEGAVQVLLAAHQDPANFVPTEYSAQSVVEQQLQENRAMRTLLILTTILNTDNFRPDRAQWLEFGATYIVPALQLGALVREAAVVCWTKLGLALDVRSVQSLAGPDDYLSQIVDNPAEPVSVRVQAILALADWCITAPSMLTPDLANSLCNLVNGHCQGNPSSHQNDSTVLACVAAEVLAKFLWSGKWSNTDDQTWLVPLWTLYFDPLMEKARLADEEDDETVPGSPRRVQQLLQVFFPAYARIQANHSNVLLSSLEPVLMQALACGGARKAAGKRHKAWPLLRMVDYLVETLASTATPAMYRRIAGAVVSVLMQARDASPAVRRDLCKLLETMPLDKAMDPVEVASLQDQVKQLLSGLSDAACRKSLSSFQAKLGEFLDGGAGEASTMDHLVERLQSVDIGATAGKENSQKATASGKRAVGKKPAAEKKPRGKSNRTLVEN